MKRKRNILVGLILGLLISAVIASFYLPFVLEHFSFLSGFIVCFIIGVLGFLWSIVWGKTVFLKTNKRYTLLWLLVFVVLGGLTSVFFIQQQQKSFLSQKAFQDKEMEQQLKLQEAVRNSNLVFLMANVFNKIDDELKNNSNRKISEETISRIATLSYFLKPHWYEEGDSLSEKRRSPERGQLLLTLCQMEIDSNSFDQIKKRTSFAGADLRKADLRQAKLNGINLKGAHLKGANLSKANLRDANLKEANLWGANLNKADLNGANLYQSNCAWAEMNETNLSNCKMDGADFTSAKMRKTDMSQAKLKWAYMNGTFLNEASFVEANLIGAYLKRSNLNGANFSNANLTFVNLSEANLTQTNLTSANLEKTKFKEANWLEKLNTWQVIGAKEIQDNYKVVVDATGQANYRVIKNKK